MFAIRIGFICWLAVMLLSSWGYGETVQRSHGSYHGHRWEIDEDHLLLWDGKPYVRYGFTGNGPIQEMMQMGFTQFNEMPGEDWALVDDPERLEEVVRAADEYTDQLERAGATYYAGLNVFWPWRYGNRIKRDSDRVNAFLRAVVSLTEQAEDGKALQLTITVPVNSAEQDKVKVVEKRMLLFDLQMGRMWDVTGYLSEIRPMPSSEPMGDEELGKRYLLAFKPFSLPSSQDLRLVVGLHVLLDEAPNLGPSSIPALWKPGIIKHYRDSLRVFRKAYARDGLRGMMFGDEINTFEVKLLTARAYLDVASDPIALKAYRDWLKRRFGEIARLNEYMHTGYTSFDEVEWLTPLHPFNDEDRELKGEEELNELCRGFARSPLFPFRSFAHLEAAGEVQDEFRVWFYGHWLARYAKMAKETIGDVPVFLCSAGIGGDAHEYLRIHRWALIEGVDGLIRNCYGHPRTVDGKLEIYQPWGERFPLETLVAWMDEVQRISGRTKYLMANEIGHPNQAGDNVRDDFGLGGVFSFPSKEAMRNFMLAMIDYGYKGLNLFAMDPTHPARRQEVRWMAELRDEIVKRIVQTKRFRREPPRVERTITFRFPATARVHVPDAYNAASLIDAEAVSKEWFRNRLAYQFVLVEDNGRWVLISHRSAVPNAPFPTVSISPTDDGISLTLSDVDPRAVRRDEFASMDEAIADYQGWLEEAYHIGRLGEHPNKPAWLANVRLVLTVDLWRPNGEITQDFEDVTRFLRELHRAGAPEDTLLYLCGWSGPYDGRYPEYWPAEELGETAKFKELVETAHRYGYRVMIHTCPVAFDPYLPSFEQFKDCALRGDDFPGGYKGWQGGYQSRKLDFDSGRQRVNAKTVTLTVPDKCEALLTVGSFGRRGLKVTVHDRTLSIPPDASDPYTFPFTFFFDKGENEITFSSVPQGLWYRIHDARQFIHVWTYPFVGMNPRSEKWRDYLTRKLTAVVKEFGLDAVHLDAHVIGGSTWDCMPLFEQLMEALPGVAFSCEEALGEVGLKTFGLTQGCRMEQDMLLSPISAKLSEPYIRFYWHLVAARSFVPVGVVWNIDPPAKVTEQSREELKRDLARARRLGIIPTVRINARQFGLDTWMREILKSLD